MLINILRDCGGHENPQDPICDRGRNVFVVTFSNLPLLLVSKIQIDIAPSEINSEYSELYHSVRALTTLKSLIKEVIENLATDSENMKFVSISTVYDENNGAIVLEKSPGITTKSKQISVRYHWFRQHIGKESVIWKIELENQKADIFTKGLKIKLFSRIRKLL